MANDVLVEWEGASGKAYVYQVATIGLRIEDEPGNYIFARETEEGRWFPLYIGETVNLGVRLNEDHEKLPCARQHGATHVHFHANWLDDHARVEEKADLVAKWAPPCND